MKMTDILVQKKTSELFPAIIQDANTNLVLMLGYMNEDALQKTIETKWVTFFSRSQNRLWTKGEVSGNKLELVDIFTDCDKDSLLITANPIGPTCHNGTTTCFGQSYRIDWSFIQNLEVIIKQRDQWRPERSYTAKLLNSGISRIAQKVGEEGVEVLLAAIEKNNDNFCAEVADWFFHVLVLLRAKNLSLSNVIEVLRNRSSST